MSILQKDTFFLIEILYRDGQSYRKDVSGL
jgi:hypothetical protein